MDNIPKKYLYALGAFVFGGGVLAFAVGLFSDLYSWEHGLIGMIVLWVTDFVFGVYYLAGPAGLLTMPGEVVGSDALRTFGVRRYLWTMWALIFGLGLLVFAIGLLSDAYSWQYGLIGMIALWVMSFSLRIFLRSRSEN